MPVGSDISGPHRSFCGAMNMKFREKDFLSFMRYMFVRSLFFFSWKWRRWLEIFAYLYCREVLFSLDKKWTWRLVTDMSSLVQIEQVA